MPYREDYGILKRNLQVSSIKQHHYDKVKKIIKTPLNSLNNMSPSYWHNERLPEYLWIGLILMYFNRKDAFQKLRTILLNIIEIVCCPYLSRQLSPFSSLIQKKPH